MNNFKNTLHVVEESKVKIPVVKEQKEDVQITEVSKKRKKHNVEITEEKSDGQ